MRVVCSVPSQSWLICMIFVSRHKSDGELSVSPMKCQWQLHSHICLMLNQLWRPMYTGPVSQKPWQWWAEGKHHWKTVAAFIKKYKMRAGGGGRTEAESEGRLPFTHFLKQLILLYWAWCKHFLRLQLWHVPACVIKGAFLPFSELKATSRAWLSFSASTSNMRQMPNRRSLHQSLLPQQTALMWRLNSQRYRRKHSLHFYAKLLNPYIVYN